MNDCDYLNLQLKSSEWILNKVLELTETYKKCKTENSKRKVVIQLKSLYPKLNFEFKRLENIIQKAKDEGIEF